jgi:hypothetical protein
MKWLKPLLLILTLSLRAGSGMVLIRLSLSGIQQGG